MPALGAGAPLKGQEAPAWRAVMPRLYRRVLVLAAVLGVGLCGVLLLAGGAGEARREELVGGLLPLKQDWSDRLDHESVHARVVAPHRSGHRIFAPLDEPVRRSITSDIPNMVDTALEPTNNYEDKLNRKLLRLQREKSALTDRRQDIIDGLVSDRDWQQRRAAAKAVVAHHQRLRDALKRARQREWALYEKYAMSYALAKTHSTARADQYLRRRSRVMSRINELDRMLWDGDGQTTTERGKWHQEWAPYELSHSHDDATKYSSSSSSQSYTTSSSSASTTHSSSSAGSGDIDRELDDILGQAAAVDDAQERKALLDKVKQLHDIIKGGSKEDRMLTIPDKRSWRKMNTEYKDYSRFLTRREPNLDEAWAWHEPKSSNFEWRHRDEKAT